MASQHSGAAGGKGGVEGGGIGKDGFEGKGKGGAMK